MPQLGGGGGGTGGSGQAPQPPPLQFQQILGDPNLGRGILWGTGNAGVSGSDLSVKTLSTGTNKLTQTYLQMKEVNQPDAPDLDGVRLFCRDDGGGKSQFVAIFNTGAIQVIASQP